MRDLTHEQRELYILMSDISEYCYCAGWMNGNEFKIWDAMNGGSRDYGMAQISDSDIDLCRELSQKIGGWIVWWDDRNEKNLPPARWGPRFVPMEQWVKMYEAEK